MASLRAWEIICLVYSILLFATGIILIAFSGDLIYDVFHYYKFLPKVILGPFFLFLILGIGHLLLTWLGINGPRREHNFHIVLFMVFTVVLFMCECSVAIWCIVLRDEVAVESTELMTKSFKAETISSGHEVDNNWAKLQSELGCCGLYGSTDYGVECPISCLNINLSNPALHICYEDGCQKPFIKFGRGLMMKAAVIGFLAAFYQCLGFFLFWKFFKALREKRAERLAQRAELQRQMSEGQQQGIARQSAEVPLMQNPAPARKSSAPSPPTTTT